MHVQIFAPKKSVWFYYFFPELTYLLTWIIINFSLSFPSQLVTIILKVPFVIFKTVFRHVNYAKHFIIIFITDCEKEAVCYWFYKNT